MSEQIKMSIVCALRYNISPLDKLPRIVQILKTKGDESANTSLKSRKLYAKRMHVHLYEVNTYTVNSQLGTIAKKFPVITEE
jgi:hypothetical protein